MNREAELIKKYNNLTPESQNMALNTVLVAEAAEAAVKKQYGIKPDQKPVEQERDKK